MQHINREVHQKDIVELTESAKFINRVLVGDALIRMKEVPSNLIDLTVTSPPYNKGEQGAVLISAVKYDSYRDNLPEDEYREKQIAILDELYRVTKEGGSCFYNHRPRWVKGKPMHPFEWLQKTRWQMRQQIIWNRKICGNLRAWRFYQTHEEIWWLWKDNGKSPGENQINMSQATIGSVWNIPPYQNKGNNHPCLFPPTIPARCILATTKKGDLVFDPFAGCGTTLMTANQLERGYLGIDISPQYAELSEDRISNPYPGDLESIEKEKDLMSQ